MTCRYRFISEHHATYGVTRLCRVLAVPRRQGYYEWLAAQPARQERAEAEDELAGEIRAIHGEHQGRYGSPRVAEELRRRGRRVNRKRVERMMRERHIVGLTRRRRRSLTKQDTTAAPAPDLIGRDFTAPAPGQRLVGDITYLPTRKAGSTWPPRSTCSTAKWSATRWPNTCAPNWSATPSSWPTAAAWSSPTRSSTPTAGRSTPRPSSGLRSRHSTCGLYALNRDPVTPRPRTVIGMCDVFRPARSFDHARNTR